MKCGEGQKEKSSQNIKHVRNIIFPQVKSRGSAIRKAEVDKEGRQANA